ncbi:unnamed protein product [Rotaria sp. Silwood2]|nr:unnamed protein product [Rotaria sp. Silwood2]CAF4232455.1 unnamed protein product [Rotaria sp. Silwood2]
MGSKSGKYEIDHDNFIQFEDETLSAFSSSSNGSIASERLRKEEAFLSTFVHSNFSNDILSSKMDNLTLVWLDTEMNNRPDSIDTQIRLKNVINYLRIFDQVDACERYIKRIGEMNNINKINEEKLLLVISTTVPFPIISYFHGFTQVKDIYIYGKSKTNSSVIQQFVKNHCKVYIQYYNIL